MSMHVCGQTLVLIDNDATVSEVNQKLVKATVRYMFYHLPPERAFSVNTYEHDITGTENFLTDPADLVCDADRIEYAPKDSNLSDTLCEVLMRWKESDFACRDIIVFTDGLEGAALDHEKEELYYLLERCEYPVYVVMLDQENNAEARKGLSAIAVTSGGRFYETEFPGSEAEVDKQLGEMIFAAMDEYANAHWRGYEEDAEDGYAGKEVEEAEDMQADGTDGESTDVVSTTGEAEIYNMPYDVTGKVVYEYKSPDRIFGGPKTLVLSLMLIGAGLLFGILGGFVMMRKRRTAPAARSDAPDEEDLFGEYELGGMSTTDLAGDTVFLSDETEADNPTRLLCDDAAMLTLEDKTDPKRNYRIMLAGKMTIGRGSCDVMITGDDALSKRHCELFEKDGRVYVRDLSSSNGTRVNGVKVSETPLSDEDELAIGSRTYIVRL